MNIYLFGKTSLSGEAFYKFFNFQNSKYKIYSFSRDKKRGYKLDLKKPDSFSPLDNEEFILISFAPIWHFAYFLNYLFYHQNFKLVKLKGIIICSHSPDVLNGSVNE